MNLRVHQSWACCQKLERDANLMLRSGLPFTRRCGVTVHLGIYAQTHNGQGCDQPPISLMSIFETSVRNLIPFILHIPHPHIPLFTPFHHTQTIGSTTADMATEAMAPEMLSYLDSCSEDMASQIIGALQQAGRRAAPNAAASMTVTGSAVTKIEKKQRQKAKPAPATGGPKRPLNSWMAYRSMAVFPLFSLQC